MIDYNQATGFNTGLAVEVGVNAAIVFSELSFWQGKGARADGWIYKSYAEMLEKLPFMSEYQLRSAYKALKKAGYIDIKLMKVENAPIFHYKITMSFQPHSEETSESIETEETSESINTVNNHYLTESEETGTTILVDDGQRKNSAKSKTDFKDIDPLWEKQMGESLFFELVEALGFDRTRVRLSTERRKKLQARLKVYTQTDLLKAAKAIRNSAYMQGDNPGRVRYGTIEYLLRSDDKVEQWLLNGEEEKGIGWD